MNKKSWDRMHKQLENYKDDNLDARNKFWDQYMTSGSPDEWKCSECDCQAFKMDNLRYLEARLKEKKYGQT
jgi:hypothetical protein